MIYTHDHQPQHVHIRKAGMAVEIYLVDLAIKDQNRRATNKFIREAWELVEANQEFLLSEWERIKPIP